MATETDETKAEPDTDADPAGGDGDRRRSMTPAVWVAWLVALVASVGAGVMFLAGDDAESADVAAARAVAARFGAAYLSFDSTAIDRTESVLLSLTTESFGAEFADTRLPSVESLFSGSDTKTVAETTDVFVSEVDGDRIRALVFVDVTATTADGEQRLVNLSFVLDLRDDDRWRVDGVSPVPIAEIVGESAPNSTEPSGDSAPTEPGS